MHLDAGKITQHLEGVHERRRAQTGTDGAPKKNIVHSEHIVQRMEMEMEMGGLNTGLLKMHHVNMVCMPSHKSIHWWSVVGG